MVMNQQRQQGGQSWTDFHSTYSSPKSSTFGVYGSPDNSGGGMISKFLTFCDGPQASKPHKSNERRSSGLQLFRTKPNKGNIKFNELLRDSSSSRHHHHHQQQRRRSSSTY